MVHRPHPERRGPGASPPGQSGVSPTLIICLTIIFAIGGVVMVGMTQEAMGWNKTHDQQPPRVAPSSEYGRLYANDLKWNSVGCAYLSGGTTIDGSNYVTPLVVPNEATPDPSDGKLLCDPTKARS